MFLHNFKYHLLITLRDKGQIFWSFIFVAVLGTLFWVTFGNAYDGAEMLTDIQVSVYIEDDMVSQVFSNMIADISLNDSGDKLLDIRYADSREEAEKLLDEDEVLGMYYSEGGELKLMIKDDGIREAILSSVVTNYHQIMTVMNAVAEKGEDQIASAMIKLLAGDSKNVERRLTDSSMDMFTAYFYNLIAMGCLFASFAGITVTRYNQANLSPIGARKCAAQTGNFASVSAALLANLVLLFLCEMLAILYLTLIGVDFGNKIGQMVLLVLVGTWTGVTLGYFVGSIGKLKEGAKEGICVGISLTLCFLSGLMIGDMKVVVQQNCPWFNKINPAALISDSFYALNVYDVDGQFRTNIVSLAVLSFMFVIGGVLLGRRKRYASI